MHSYLIIEESPVYGKSRISVDYITTPRLSVITPFPPLSIGEMVDNISNQILETGSYATILFRDHVRTNVKYISPSDSDHIPEMMYDFIPKSKACMFIEIPHHNHIKYLLK